MVLFLLKIYDKRDDFDFGIVTFLFLMGVKKVRSAIKLIFFEFRNFAFNDINGSESN